METTSQRTASAPAGPARRRRRWPAYALLAVLAMLVVVGLAAVTLLGVRADLDEGRTALERARRDLAQGDVAAAEEGFRDAAAAFRDADRRASGVVVRVAGWLPAVGNNVDVASAIAEAGVEVSEAGRGLTAAIAAVPDGVGSLAPRDGRFPIEAVDALAAPVADAASSVRVAADTVEASPASFLFGDVQDARWEAIDLLGDAADALEAGDLLLRGLPAFAGADGPRRYLVAAENPAEQRGPGGLWGAYAVLTLDEGVPRFSGVSAIPSMPEVDAADVPPPSPDFDENYAEFGGAGSWHNLNMTPDFPTAARAAIGAYETATGTSIDGMIVADPYALQETLRVTGPTVVPGVGVRVRAADVVDFTTNEAYALFTSSTGRKEVLGGVAIDALGRLFALPGQGEAKLRALARAAAGGHLKVYAEDETFARGLALVGADGRFPPQGATDLFAVTVNNAAGTKVDYYATRSLAYDVTLGGRGEALATASVTLGNEAPTSGQPRIVIGSYVEDLRPGDQRSITRLWCPAACRFVDAGLDGGPVTLDTGTEAGLPWYRTVETLGPDEERTVQLVTGSAGTWEGNGSGGVYRLVVRGQTTMRPTPLRVTVRVPEGTRVVWTSEPMTVEGRNATWEGHAPPTLELEVRFQAPWPLRWWRNALRPLGGL